MKKIALFGGSFNPPGDHHLAIARLLVAHFDSVIIVPCGPRSDKESTQQVTPFHRGEMAKLAFAPLIKELAPKLELDLFDLHNSLFTRTYLLEQRYASRGEVWHVVGADLICGGAQGKSQIQTEWMRGEELWRESRFAVITRPGVLVSKADFPPQHVILPLEVSGSSSEIRENIIKNQGAVDLSSEVKKYILNHGLYR